MRSGDNHPNKCHSCHGCTIDNTCSQWTDIVWAGIVERSQNRLKRKRHAVSGTQVYDKPSTTLKPALRDEHIHKRLAYRQGAFLATASWDFLLYHPQRYPYQWTYAGGPTLGGIPETFLRSGAGDPAGSPEPNPEIEPVRLRSPNVRSRSPNVREIPEPGENPRCHTVRLVSPVT
ncbi:hypothetical protein NP493_985g00028 [Ridgeia piscesae]|uniref:Uncharacterized protein n=1 Tax=Ridgeia piscesae TaxID=27915 RepID=A0AAD9KJ13_RIDPI|nr:hypothetical protein NP493_985g00028 [Ridgeia piscesae]